MNLFYSLIHKPKKDFRTEEFSPEKILVVQIAGIGDLVLATPAIKALKERYPYSRLDVLTSPRADILLENFPAVERIYTFDIEELRNPLSLMNPDNMSILRDQLNPLKSEKYDLIVSLNNVATTRGGITLGLLLKTLKVPVWVGRNTNNRAPYFDLALNENVREKISEAETKLKVVSLLGAKTDSHELSLNLSQHEIDEALKLMRGKENLIALMPGANVDLKIWPIERFIEVGEWLINKGHTLVLLGGPGDTEICGKIEDGLGKEAIRRLDGKLTLRQTAAVLTHMTLALTNDTGPMHIAAAVKTPLVALFCSLNVKRYFPWMDKDNYRLLTTAVPDEETPEGMRASILGVTVDEVKNAISELLE